DLERAGVRGAQLRDLRDELGDRLGTGKVDREHAVPAGGAPERTAARPARREPDRDTRPLDRARLEPAVPERGQALERLVEHLGLPPRVLDLTERRQLAVARTPEAEPEHEPSAAQVVERDR